MKKYYEWDEHSKTVKPKFDGFSQVARNPDGLTQLERQLRERAEYCHRHGETITANLLDQAVSAIQRQIQDAYMQERSKR